MDLYFDETIFTDARTFRNIDNFDEDTIFVVANRADAFLLNTVHNIPTVSLSDHLCARPKKKPVVTDDNDVDRGEQIDVVERSTRVCINKHYSMIVNINTKTPCMGINVSTMNMTKKRLQTMEPYNQIHVLEIIKPFDDNIIIQPINFELYKMNVVYTINPALTSFEAAILIKYYAINNENVCITHLLYTSIRKHFLDTRAWFRRNQYGYVQNFYGELYDGDNLVNLPIVNISGPRIDLM